MGKIYYGIHKNTITSRDTNYITVNSKEQAITRLEELEKDHKCYGYVIWFANYEDDYGNKIQICDGNSDYNN